MTEVPPRLEIPHQPKIAVKEAPPPPSPQGVDISTLTGGATTPSDQIAAIAEIDPKEINKSRSLKDKVLRKEKVTREDLQGLVDKRVENALAERGLEATDENVRLVQEEVYLDLKGKQPDQVRGEIFLFKVGKEAQAAIEQGDWIKAANLVHKAQERSFSDEGPLNQFTAEVTSILNGRISGVVKGNDVETFIQAVTDFRGLGILDMAKLSGVSAEEQKALLESIQVHIADRIKGERFFPLNIEWEGLKGAKVIGSENIGELNQVFDAFVASVAQSLAVDMTFVGYKLRFAEQLGFDPEKIRIAAEGLSHT